ncbi:hypothetical protein L6164_031703 [Bauhinia variegata]|uniref:Uncharacterized protein n=1 Tax=Bauhinia variegata TaxID=167791 RepID=A0ACB9LGM0_BAUVA|nr:hypothetical protein L6164_031703 [Bauhinia variegata]
MKPFSLCPKPFFFFFLLLQRTVGDDNNGAANGDGIPEVGFDSDSHLQSEATLWVSEYTRLAWLEKKDVKRKAAAAVAGAAQRSIAEHYKETMEKFPSTEIEICSVLIS